MVSHAGGSSSARRKRINRSGGRLILLPGGRSPESSPARVSNSVMAPEPPDLQRDLVETMTKFHVLEEELRAQLPQEVMRLVDALTDAAHDIASLEAALGANPYA